MDLEQGLDIIGNEAWTDDVQLLIRLADEGALTHQDVKTISTMVGHEFHGDFTGDMMQKLTNVIQGLKGKCQVYQSSLRNLALSA